MIQVHFDCKLLMILGFADTGVTEETPVEMPPISGTYCSLPYFIAGVYHNGQNLFIPRGGMLAVLYHLQKFVRSSHNDTSILYCTVLIPPLLKSKQQQRLFFFA